MSSPSTQLGSPIVLGFGAAVVDLLATVASFPNPDDKIRSTSMKVQGGGNAGNALTCAARLGLNARLISKVANDVQGRGVLEELRDDGRYDIVNGVVEVDGLKDKATTDQTDGNSKEDLDDTLYPLSAGLADEVLNNIKDYMAEKLGIDLEKIPEMCNLLYKHYGTTMAGIRAMGYDFDYDEYHSFVHGRLPYENLKPDPVLRNLLLSLPIRKFIFTNADKIHAAKVVSKLGLEDPCC